MFSSRNTHTRDMECTRRSNKRAHKIPKKRNTPREKREIQQSHKEKATWTYCKLIVQFCSNICYSHPIKVPSRQVAKRWFKAFAFNVYFFLCEQYLYPEHIMRVGEPHFCFFRHTQRALFYTHKILMLIVDNCCSIPKIPMHTHTTITIFICCYIEFLV